jgi:hypothetical protein
MKILLKIIFVLFFISACSENSTEPEDEKEYLSVPTEEGIMLYYRIFDSVRLDSTIAGEIQYRLDIAKSVVEDTTIKVRKDWVFGDLRLFTNQELYDSFDTTKNRFNYPSIDSLLTIYELIEIESLEKRLTSYSFYLLFPEYYNMVNLSEIFRHVNGVVNAEQNIIGGPPICKEDITLLIDNNVYKFVFHGDCPPNVWEVHVVDDSIAVVEEGG